MSKGGNVVDKESKRREKERLALKALRAMNDETLAKMVELLVREAEESKKEQYPEQKTDKKCDCK